MTAMGQEGPLPSQAPTDCCPFRKRSLAGVCAYSRENPGPGGRGGANGGGARPNSLRNMVRLNLAAYLGKIPADAKGWGRNSGAALPNCPAKYGSPQSRPLGENPRPAEGVGRK
jgi:hypothetical protein